jgi:hypothetical protein
MNEGSYNPFGLSFGFQPGDVISYMEMCSAVGVNLQRGMNFRLRDTERYPDEPPSGCSIRRSGRG